MQFIDLGLKPELLQAVTELGFKEPMPIQAEAIPLLLNPETKDFIGLAQTGTGKTCAFGLPLLQQVEPSDPATQALILSPTRELCLQIGEELARFARYLKGVQPVAVYGGAPIDQQIRKLQRGAQVIVATPGRLNDLIRRRAVNLSTVKVVVLDEADEMLDMGFKDELNTILDTVEDSAVWLFSATMAPEVERMTRNYLTKPARVTIGTQNEAGKNIAHHAYKIVDRKRYECLRRIIDYTPEMFGLVFCRTRHDTQELSEKLMHDGVYAEALHGDLSQAQRDSVMKKFRSHAVKILCATDVAARGLDVNDITHVIHYHLPDDPAVYTHRSGRTARAGKSGVSIVLAGPRELSRIRVVERIAGIRCEMRQVPGADEVRQRHLFRVIEEIQEIGEAIHPEISQMMEALLPALGDISREDLLARMLELRLRPLMIAYENAADLNPVKPDPKSFGEKGARPPRDNRPMQRIMINVGRLDHLREGAIVRIVCENANLESNAIGAIDIKREFAFFDVDKTLADQALVGLASAQFDGRPINAKFVDSAPEDDRRKPRGKSGGKPYAKKGGFYDKKGGAGTRADDRPRRGGSKPAYKGHTEKRTHKKK